MTFTYDIATDIGRMRLLVGDTNEARPDFQDEEYAAFDALFGGVLRGAAAAIRRGAKDLAWVLRKTQTLGLTVDGVAPAESLRKYAESLDEKADFADAGDGSLFDIAEFALDPFGTAERLTNERLRSGL